MPGQETALQGENREDAKGRKREERQGRPGAVELWVLPEKGTTDSTDVTDLEKGKPALFYP